MIVLIYNVYLSPDGKILRSMKKVQRSLGILPKKIHSTCIEEDLDNAETKVDNINFLCYLDREKKVFLRAGQMAELMSLHF